MLNRLKIKIKTFVCHKYFSPFLEGLENASLEIQNYQYVDQLMVFTALSHKALLMEFAFF